MQEKALAHGPNFAVVTKEPPVSEYISQIERVCQQLKQGKVEELRGEIKLILKNIQPPNQTSPKRKPEQYKKLNKDKERIILTADKGVSMVVMDKENVLRNQKNYCTKQHTKN